MNFSNQANLGSKPCRCACQRFVILAQMNGTESSLALKATSVSYSVPLIKHRTTGNTPPVKFQSAHVMSKRGFEHKYRNRAVPVLVSLHHILIVPVSDFTDFITLVHLKST